MEFRTTLKKYAEVPISRHLILELLRDYQRPNDKIVLTPKLYLRSMKQTQVFLIEDLRIDQEILSSLDINLMKLWIKNAPKRNSLKMLIKTLPEL